MLNVFPYNGLGRANYGWLDARHHFSFAEYYDPNRMGFGALRVVNDDIIAPGTGFDMHRHQDMEIITFVREGAITHRDSNGNQGRTVAGDVQVMSAGTGIYHSEKNAENIPTNLYQIWIEPNELGVKPRWDDCQFSRDKPADALELLVSGDGKAPLQIHQDAYIYAGHLAAGTSLQHPIHGQAYVLVSQGTIDLDKNRLSKGDGAAVSSQKTVSISVLETAEILFIDVPPKPTR